MFKLSEIELISVGFLTTFIFKQVYLPRKYICFKILNNCSNSECIILIRIGRMYIMGDKTKTEKIAGNAFSMPNNIFY